MNKYEELIAEYENVLYIREKPMHNDALYCDGNICINSALPQINKRCLLAEEIGHHKRTVGNILDQSKTDNIRQELKARAWAYEELCPIENILFAIKDGHCEIWDMAEYLDLTEDFLKEAIEYYIRKAVLIFD